MEVIRIFKKNKETFEVVQVGENYKVERITLRWAIDAVFDLNNFGICKETHTYFFTVYPT